MANTVPLRWEPIKRKELKGKMLHSLRGAETKQGKFRQFSNENVNLNFSHLNREKVIWHGAEEDLRDIGKLSDEIIDYCDRVGLIYARKIDGQMVEVRNNLFEHSNLLFEAVISVDREYLGLPEAGENSSEPPMPFYKAIEKNPELLEKTNKILEVMRDVLIEQFGEKNCVYYTTNLDETTPHLHLGVIPETDKGISFTDFFGGRKGREKSREIYRKIHDSVRQKLAEHGYETSLERVSSGKSVSAKDYRKLSDQRRALSAKEAALSATAASLDQRQADLAEREQGVAQREAAAAAREKAVKRLEVKVKGERESFDGEMRRGRAKLNENAEELRQRARELSARERAVGGLEEQARLNATLAEKRLAERERELAKAKEAKRLANERLAGVEGLYEKAALFSHSKTLDVLRGIRDLAGKDSLAGKGAHSVITLWQSPQWKGKLDWLERRSGRKQQADLKASQASMQALMREWEAEDDQQEISQHAVDF